MLVLRAYIDETNSFVPINKIISITRHHNEIYIVDNNSVEHIVNCSYYKQKMYKNKEDVLDMIIKEMESLGAQL